MKTKDYIVIKDNKIIMMINTSQGMEGVLRTLENTPYDDIQEFEGNPVNKGVRKNDDIRIYDKDWKKRPLADIVKEKLVEVPKGKKVDKTKNEFVEMTIKEKIDSGDIVLQPYEKYDTVTKKIIPKTWKEKVDESLATYEEYLSQVIRPYRNSLLNEADLIYCNPERWYSYTEAEKQKWSKYKQELKDFTNKSIPIEDDVRKIKFPNKPNGKTND
jgi:hypothetical protein